ncbi:MAG: site-2 protease family protein [bacterium]
MSATYLAEVLLIIPPILVALSIHEAAHAWSADLLGDPTARLQGRLTLNPLAHLDPIGTVVLVVTRMVGWAKPVPVDVRNLKDPVRDMFWIAGAGPASNIMQAAVVGVGFRLFAEPGMQLFRTGQGGLLGGLLLMLHFYFYINIVLAWFNLLPVPPLDGSKIVMRFLDHRTRRIYMRTSRYGLLVLILLIFVFDETFFRILMVPVGFTSYVLGGVQPF